MGKGKAASKAVEAGVRVFPVGKLLRRVKGLRSKVDDAAMAAKRGVPKPGRPRKIQQRKTWDMARESRDKLHDDVVASKKRMQEIRDELNGTPKPSDARRRELNGELQEHAGRGRAESVTGATDPSTGITGAGYNHKPTPPERWGCAEKGALDDINRQRADRGLPPLKSDEVDFSEARVVRTDGVYEEKPIDGWCQNRTNPEQYPNDVLFYEHDSSGGGNGWVTRYGL